MRIARYGNTQYWAVLDTDGSLICLCVYNPTATFVFDLSVATQYTPPASLLYQQEASDVTSLSDCRRRLCHSVV